MFNQVFLVGRISQMPDFKVCSHHEALIHVKVSRPYDEVTGTIIEDHIPVVLWQGLGKQVSRICHEGSYVAVKGRLLNDHFHTNASGFRIVYIKAESLELLDDDFRREFQRE